MYDAFETPRAVRGDLPILDRGEALDYLADVRAARAGDPRPRRRHPMLHEMVLQHEQQHTETMLQAIELARLPTRPGHSRRAAPARRGGGHSGLDVRRGPGRPLHDGRARRPLLLRQRAPRATAVELPGFRIGRTPITNATFLRFVEGGGYQRREWWSDEGWAWKEGYDITHPQALGRRARPGWRQWRIDGGRRCTPDEPVVHVSWFEADAFARAHALGSRPRASGRRRRPGTRSDEPAGSRGAKPRTRSANLDHGLGPAPAGAVQAGASPCGALGMLGDVWEWTASDFDGYPGFVAHPYREYSEVFFGRGYQRRCAAARGPRSARVATPTFRNWDLPQRRQIFSGVRLAHGTHSDRSRSGSTATSAGARARWPTTCSTASPGRSRSCRPSTSTTPAAPSSSTAICELPEYYPTRTERAILEAQADAIVASHRRARSSSSSAPAPRPRRACCSTRWRRAGTLRRYVPFDVAERHRARQRGRAERRVPGPRRPRASSGDFERHLDEIPPPEAGRPRIVAFLGGTIGNFTPGTPAALPARLAALLGPDDHLLLGTDLVKDPTCSRPPTTTAPGVTAEFNLNMLRVVNRELDADFASSSSSTSRSSTPTREWIEMRLRARRACSVRVGGARPRASLRPRRGAADRDLGQVHARTRAHRPRRRRARAGRVADRPRRAVRALAQPESTGSSAPSLTSVSASSAAGSESRTTPTPA